ncbi:MAG: hypothetical protein K1X31_06855, partial [Gemmatimonadaceae bacterium]|nr:hypothetical protein [Gemmatimonadaceae bacterium]
AIAQGDEQRAADAWGAALRMDPYFQTAHRALGLPRFRAGYLDEARDHLLFAAQRDPGDNVVRAALDAVLGVIAQRDAQASVAAAHAASGPDADATALLDEAVASAAAAPGAGPAAAPASAAPAAPAANGSPAAPVEEPPAPAAADAAPGAADAPREGEGPEALFLGVIDHGKQVALLLDGEGLVEAGSYLTAEGRDLGAELGAQLSGVADEAARAMRHFKLGAWTRISVETEAATLELSPAGTGMVVLAASREVPLGYVRRTFDRCVALARQWVGEGA